MLRYFCNCISKTPKTTTPEKYLEIITYQDTIPFVPPITSGKVIKVYDGDTITIASKLPYDNSPVYRFSVRLLGIDSPEIKSKTSTEKQLAIVAKDALSNLIMNKTIHLKNISTEKYGRVLANVYLDDLHVNQWMLDNNHAVLYDGGTKNRPLEWDNVI
jgi:endonuclease YncB( thermonuclease family)